MKDLDYYIECFSKLKTAYSKSRPAPHKALLLLSVIDLIEIGFITTPRIQLSDTLVETFNRNARELFRDDFFKPSIGQPFFYMKSEPFWRLEAVNPVDLELKETSCSLKNLRALFHNAVIDVDLFQLLRRSRNRVALRKVLIKRYIII